MKTFFATFAAILCAAAVIWVVYSKKKEADANSVAMLGYLESMVQNAKDWNAMMTGSGASFPDEPGNPDPVAEGKPKGRFVDDAVHFEQLLREGGAPRSAARSAASSYVFWWRDTVKFWKQDRPEWAREMTDQLDRIEALEKAM